MNTLVNTAPKNKTISLALHRDLSSGRWYVDQLDVRTDAMRSTTHFLENTSVDQAFSPMFLEQLKLYFPPNLNQTVRSLSTEVIRLEAVALAGVRVLAQSAAMGVQRVIIRFNRVIGRIYDILSDRHRPDQGYVDQIGNSETGALPDPSRSQTAGLEGAFSEPSFGSTRDEEELTLMKDLRGPPKQS